MRLTTKIMIGTFVGMLLILMALTFFLKQAVQEEPWDSLSGELVEMNVSGYKVIKLEDVSTELKAELLGNLNIENETKEHKSGTLCYPKEFKERMKSEVKGDTLLIRFSIEVKSGESNNNLGNVNLFLYTDSLVCVMNELDIKTQVKNLKVDSLMLTAINAIDLDSCEIGYLEVGDNKWKPMLDINNSQIEVLTLDLDNISRWLMHNSSVEWANLTGTSMHQIKTPEEGCKRINWKLKEKKAASEVKE